MPSFELGPAGHLHSNKLGKSRVKCRDSSADRVGWPLAGMLQYAGDALPCLSQFDRFAAGKERVDEREILVRCALHDITASSSPAPSNNSSVDELPRFSDAIAPPAAEPADGVSSAIGSRYPENQFQHCPTCGEFG